MPNTFHPFFLLSPSSLFSLTLSPFLNLSNLLNHFSLSPFFQTLSTISCQLLLAPHLLHSSYHAPKFFSPSHTSYIAYPPSHPSTLPSLSYTLLPSSIYLSPILFLNIPVSPSPHTLLYYLLYLNPLILSHLSSFCPILFLSSDLLKSNISSLSPPFHFPQLHSSLPKKSQSLLLPIR